MKVYGENAETFKIERKTKTGTFEANLAIAA